MNAPDGTIRHQMSLPLALDRAVKRPTSSIKYITRGIVAEGHTPVYKMHKYFARRPQNVFRHLLEHYSEPDDVVLDCFSGGGVTLFEGLSLNRKVIASDTNPLAAFVSESQVTTVQLNEFITVADKIRNEVEVFAKPFYTTTNRNTNEPVEVRWYEFAYIVTCPACTRNTVLSSNYKAQKNGWYKCMHCVNTFQSLEGKRVGHELLTTTYKTTTRATQRTVEPDQADKEILKYIETNFSRIIEEEALWIPTATIPDHWDRQKEDCLHRKGVIKFSDFFTKRTLLVMAFFLKKVQERKAIVSPELYRMLLLLFSGTLRYTNNLTISTEGWMDGRPVAWAKHAYWLSNQFVEVNPIEYIEKRISAIKGGLTYQQRRLQPTTAAKDYADLLSKDHSYLLMNRSSDNLPIPNDAVDLVLTDPPYGSNVQYGELSAFWLVWLEHDFQLDMDSVLGLEKEVLVHRKKSPAQKKYSDYYEGLRQVYAECFRVLKPGRPLVFTFNNKDIRAWFAVVKAAINVGFILEPEGLVYQDPIENYKNTAHTRFSGSLHGDFIYTFVKPLDSKGPAELREDVGEGEVGIVIQAALKEIEALQRPFSENEAYILLVKHVVPQLAKLASEALFEEAIEEITGSHFEKVLREKFVLNAATGLWSLPIAE